MIQTDVTVIGGGAAGLMAAITAAENGAKTVIIEHMDRVGKKILATGNGKCNYTNKLQGISYYRGENPAFVLPVFEQFGFEETVSFFEKIGIHPKPRNGYYYPASGQAASVLEVLRMEADFRKVDIHTSCNIKQIKKEKSQFLIETNQENFRTNNIIFSPGLLASPKTGSDGSCFTHIEAFGHHFVDIVPALVQLQGKQSFFKSVAGIRAEMSIDLYIENQKVQTEEGELQLTEYGISGIPVFQISRYATKALLQKKSVYATINFAPGMEQGAFETLLKNRFYRDSHGKTAGEVLIGLFHKKLIDVLLKEAAISPHTPAKKIDYAHIRQLSDTIRGLRVDITGSKDFSSAQVCAGGVDTSELHNQTLESRLVPGIYFAGEVIDIDGICGGYNLQWAWSSGYVAGIHAAKA